MGKINIAELLKDCQKGMELDCTMFEDVTFVGVDMNRKQFPIEIDVGGNLSIYLTKEGSFNDTILSPKSKCVIFPKGKTTWEGFQRPFKDGDIVAFDSVGSAQIFIFKEYIDAKNGYACCYMMLNYDGTVDFESDNYYVDRFATEEEKQKLFDAIKDNGYKWNAETKTLEKLIEPKFELGDSIRIKGTSTIYVVTEIREGCYMLDDKDFYLTFKTQDQWELAPGKFDINTLKPFDKVLVRGDIRQKWTINFFGFIDNYKKFPFECLGCSVTQCVPYEGNEHLLGNTNDCDEYYKTWK